MSQPGSQLWWHDLYDEDLETVLLNNASTTDNQAQAQEILNFLGLSHGARILDQCCGNGRLSLPLARLGCEVLGIDLVASYISKAQQQADIEGLSARFEVQDALQWHAFPPRQAVINMWTSFGYSEDDGVNLKMLQRAFDSLEPGGVFLLDTLNLPAVLHHFQPSMVSRVVTPKGDLQLERLTRFDWDRGLMLKDWIYTLSNGERKIRHSSIRLYLPHSIVALLHQAGFTAITLFGGLDFSPLSLDTLRLVIKARKHFNLPKIDAGLFSNSAPRS